MADKWCDAGADGGAFDRFWMFEAIKLLWAGKGGGSWRRVGIWKW